MQLYERLKFRLLRKYRHTDKLNEILSRPQVVDRIAPDAGISGNDWNGDGDNTWARRIVLKLIGG